MRLPQHRSTATSLPEGFRRGSGARRWGGGLALGLLGAASGACSDNQGSIFIRQVNLPVPTNNCIVTADPQNLTLGIGTLDVALRKEYTATLLVGNQLTPRGNQQSLRVETSRVQLEGSEVSATDTTGATVFGPVTVPGSGFVDPASGTDPGWGLIDSVLFAMSDALAPTISHKGARTLNVTSRVRVFGHTLGGTSVESGDFLFPISVCYGCLLSFPTDANDSSKGYPNCDIPASNGTTISAPCTPGQDDTVDCRVCQEFFPGESFCEP